MEIIINICRNKKVLKILSKNVRSYSLLKSITENKILMGKHHLDVVDALMVKTREYTSIKIKGMI